MSASALGIKELQLGLDLGGGALLFAVELAVSLDHAERPVAADHANAGGVNGVDNRREALFNRSVNLGIDHDGAGSAVVAEEDEGVLIIAAFVIHIDNTDAIKLLPRAGTYYYRIGTRGNFGYWKSASKCRFKFKK